MSDNEVNEQEEPSALRRQLAEARTALAAAQAREQQRTIADAGFDPQAGVVGLVAQAYAAQPDADWTVDAFRAFAAQQGLTPPAPSPAQAEHPVVGSPTPVTQLSEADQARMASQSRIDALNTLSQPDQTPNLRQQIDQLEAKALESKEHADWQAVFEAKSRWADQIGESARMIPESPQ